MFCQYGLCIGPPIDYCTAYVRTMLRNYCRPFDTTVSNGRYSTAIVLILLSGNIIRFSLPSRKVPCTAMRKYYLNRFNFNTWWHSSELVSHITNINHLMSAEVRLWIIPFPADFSDLSFRQWKPLLQVELRLSCVCKLVSWHKSEMLHLNRSLTHNVAAWHLD
jgi:hypothetical protein